MPRRRWDPTAHPRHPRGTRGGQFRRKAQWAMRISGDIGRASRAPLPADLDLDRIVAQHGWDKPAPTGTPAAKIHRAAREDTPHLPDGLYGRGMYVSTGAEDAEYFATGGWMDDEPAAGSIQRMVLLPNARVLTHHIYGTGREAGLAYRRRAQAAGVDIGTAAAHDGYDAVRIVGGDTGNDDPTAEDHGQFLLLNRTAALWETIPR